MSFDATKEGRTVYLSGQIDGIMHSPRKQVRELASQDPDENIIVVITSPGGSVLGGFAFMDEMALIRKELGTRFVGVVEGYAMSMGATILQACDERMAGPNAVIMVHGTSAGTGGDLKDRKAQERSIDLMHARMAKVYSERTTPAGGRSYDEWLKFWEDDTPLYLTPEEALEQGLIDTIVG